MFNGISTGSIKSLSMRSSAEIYRQLYLIAAPNLLRAYKAVEILDSDLCLPCFTTRRAGNAAVQTSVLYSFSLGNAFIPGNTQYWRIEKMRMILCFEKIKVQLLACH